MFKLFSLSIGHYGESTVVYKSKEVLQKNFHQIPIKHEHPGVISPGTIRFDFEEVLNKHTPSSIHGQRNWLNYRFAATLHRGFLQRNMTFKQDVWVFNTCIPSPQSGYLPTPHVFAGVWESHLPFTCSIPNENIQLGKAVPLTIQFRPFVPSSGLVGQELVVVDAIVKMKQYTRLWHKWNVKNEKKVVVEMPVNQGWATGKDGMQRTIMVNVPFAPRLSCTTITEPVRKTHCLKLIMRLKTASMSDRHAKELRIESKYLYRTMMFFIVKDTDETRKRELKNCSPFFCDIIVIVPVHITGPRPPTVYPIAEEEEEQLPTYSSVWEGGNDGD